MRPAVRRPAPKFLVRSKFWILPLSINRTAQAVTARKGKTAWRSSLANPVYLAVAGEATLRQVIAKGVAGKLMPAFEKSAGGTLTDQQIDNLVHGIFQTWSRSDVFAAAQPPSYAAAAKSDPEEGQKVFGEFCAQCHGADGNG